MWKYPQPSLLVLKIGDISSLVCLLQQLSCPSFFLSFFFCLSTALTLVITFELHKRGNPYFQLMVKTMHMCLIKIKVIHQAQDQIDTIEHLNNWTQWTWGHASQTYLEVLFIWFTSFRVAEYIPPRPLFPKRTDGAQRVMYIIINIVSKNLLCNLLKIEVAYCKIIG